MRERERAIERSKRVCVRTRGNRCRLISPRESRDRRDHRLIGFTKRPTDGCVLITRVVITRRTRDARHARNNEGRRGISRDAKAASLLRARVRALELLFRSDRVVREENKGNVTSYFLTRTAPDRYSRLPLHHESTNGNRRHVSVVSPGTSHVDRQSAER